MKTIKSAKFILSADDPRGVTTTDNPKHVDGQLALSADDHFVYMTAVSGPHAGDVVAVPMANVRSIRLFEKVTTAPAAKKAS